MKPTQNGITQLIFKLRVRLAARKRRIARHKEYKTTMKVTAIAIVIYTVVLVWFIVNHASRNIGQTWKRVEAEEVAVDSAVTAWDRYIDLETQRVMRSCIDGRVHEAPLIPRYFSVDDFLIPRIHRLGPDNKKEAEALKDYIQGQK
tara:strand:+ start:1432 stop:1869 length:438 start_codon:yes stop_codon:yes gene_type:complete